MDQDYVAHTSEIGDVEEPEDIPITNCEVRRLIDGLLGGYDEVEYDEGDPNCNDGDTICTNANIPIDANQPHSIVVSNIQPVAIIHTQPSLSPNYEMVLGADNQIYVLSRPDLRQLVPELFRSKRVEPVTSPVLTVDITKDTELLLDEIREHKEAYEEHLCSLTRSHFNETHRRRLQIQMMQHVQLLGQCYIQAHGHPKIWASAEFFLKKLRNLVNRSKGSPIIRELCWNLPDMHSSCVQWQRALLREIKQNQAYIQWMINENRKPQQSSHPRVMEFVVTNRAFMFSRLLPKCAVNVSKKVTITPGEIHLMILTWEELKRQKPKTSLTATIKAFVAHYAPWRDPYSCREQFRRGHVSNPVPWKYRNTGQVPEVIPESMDYVSYDDVVQPSQRAKGTLPTTWNTYVFSNERVSVK